MENTDVSRLTRGQISELTKALIRFLTEDKSLSQNRIAAKIGISGAKLSRLKKPEEGKRTFSDRKGIALNIIKTYGLSYTLDNGTFVINEDEEAKRRFEEEGTNCYVYYYWGDKNRIFKALFSVSSDWQRAVVRFFRDDNNEVYRFESREIVTLANNTFIDLQNDEEGSRSQLVLYHGKKVLQNEKINPEFILATYSGARVKDSAPVAGLVILQKMPDKEAALIEVRSAEVLSHIKALLLEQHILVNPALINYTDQLAALKKDHGSLSIIEGTFENYHLTSDRKHIARSVMSIESNGLVSLKGRGNYLYFGKVEKIGNTLYISATDDKLSILKIFYVLDFKPVEFRVSKTLHGTSCTVDQNNIPKANREVFIRTEVPFDDLSSSLIGVNTKAFDELNKKHEGLGTSLSEGDNNLIRV